MNLTAAELAILKRFVEERDRDTAHVTAAPADTAQYLSPNSPNSEISSDACVCVDMEEKYEEGKMNPSRRSSNYHRLVRVLKHPDSSVPRTGRQDEPLPTAFCLLAWARTRGETFFSPLKSL